MSRLSGLGALVVGGGSGIGRAAALAYFAEGARVTVVERSPGLADALEADTEGQIRTLVGDGTVPAVLEEAVARATSAGTLDHLTCCVGVFDHYASLRELPIDRLVAAGEEVWRVNVMSSLLAVRIAWPQLSYSRGSVTLTLSESAFGARGGGVLYGSSKWALRGVVQHLASDLAPEVRVNGIAPGGTADTRFAGIEALGKSDHSVSDVQGRDERIAAANLLHTTPTPEDHAATFVHLADPKTSRVVTGQVLLTNGGSAHR